MKRLNQISSAAARLIERFPGEEVEDGGDFSASLIDAIHPGICVVNVAGQVVHVNQSCCELFGYDRTTLLESNFEVLVAPERRVAMQHLHDEVIRGNTVHPFETTLQHADGRAIWIQLASNRLRFGAGNFRVISLVDITERKRLEQSLQVLATTDSLTGLANRRHFLEQARHTVLRGRRTGKLPAVVMIDLDHFKRINDTRGHSTGDRVLIEFALCCERGLRESDVLGRLGGEEFALLLPEVSANAGAETAERLRRALAGLTVSAPEGPLHFSASFGVASVGKSEGTIEAALHRADIALYHAKRAGRNRVELYTPEMESALSSPGGISEFSRRLLEEAGDAVR